MKRFNIFAVILLSGCMLFSAMAPALAQQEAKPEAPAAPTAPAEATLGFTASVDFLSQYVFRGVAASADSAVIQPSLTYTYKGFAINVWGNLDTDQALFDRDEAKWNETDLTVSYSREVYKNLTLNGGFVRYFFHNLDYDALEVFAGASYALPFQITTTFTFYRELTDFPGWWFQFDIVKTFPIPYHGMSFDLGASFGYEILEQNFPTIAADYSEWHSGTITGTLKIPVNKYLTVAPKFGIAFPLTGQASTFIRANSWDNEDVHPYGGINLTASF